MSPIDFSLKKKKPKKSKVSEKEISKLLCKSQQTFQTYSSEREPRKEYKVRGQSAGVDEAIEKLIYQFSKKQNKQIWEEINTEDCNLNEIDIPSEYIYLLDQLYDELKLSNCSQNKITLEYPQISKLPKKTVLVNYKSICKNIKREAEHFKLFLSTELCTTTTVDGNERLIIKGIFTNKNIENIIRKYIIEYVKCNNCNSLNTNMNKNPRTRLFNLECNNCNAQRNITSIKTLYEHDLSKRRYRE